jgi:hypothetical protein
MRSKLTFLAATLMLLATPIFAQIAGSGTLDLNLRSHISRWASHPVYALVLIESLALYTLVITFVARYTPLR